MPERKLRYEQRQDQVSRKRLQRRRAPFATLGTLSTAPTATTAINTAPNQTAHQSSSFHKSLRPPVFSSITGHLYMCVALMAFYYCSG
ncbi:MAG: hypothetical protein IH874_09595 [Candidatus Dadabacteria bacterium]|nr:hypothetical protein [Candidatus Dadabacteria bacterium]